jgi:hypothetical protein
MRRCREDRLFEQIFPIAGEFLLGDDVALAVFAGAVDNGDFFTEFRGCR